MKYIFIIDFFFKFFQTIFIFISQHPNICRIFVDVFWYYFFRNRIFQDAQDPLAKMRWKSLQYLSLQAFQIIIRPVIDNIFCQFLIEQIKIGQFGQRIFVCGVQYSFLIANAVDYGIVFDFPFKHFDCF